LNSVPRHKKRKRTYPVPYASAVGSLMYAMVCTRPDIAHNNVNFETGTDTVTRFVEITKNDPIFKSGDAEYTCFF